MYLCICVVHPLQGVPREKREKSFKCFLDDLKRCELLGLQLYNFQCVVGAHISVTCISKMLLAQGLLSGQRPWKSPSPVLPIASTVLTRRPKA